MDRIYLFLFKNKKLNFIFDKITLVPHKENVVNFGLAMKLHRYTVKNPDHHNNNSQSNYRPPSHPPTGLKPLGLKRDILGPIMEQHPKGSLIFTLIQHINLYSSLFPNSLMNLTIDLLQVPGP